MSIEMAANCAEVIGGITVFISLVYVSIQIRENTRVNQGIATQQTFASTQTIYSWHADNYEVSELFAKFNQGETLTVPETVRITHLMLGMMEQYQVYFILNKLRMMDDESFNSFFRKILLVLATPTARDWFRHNKNFFSRDFVEHVEDLLEGNPRVTRVLSGFYGLDLEPA